MLKEKIRPLIERYLSKDVDLGKHIYFKHYYSSIPLEEADLVDILIKELNINSPIKEISKRDYSRIITVNGENIIFYAISNEDWLVIFSNALPHQICKNLKELSKKVGWLLDAWIQGETLEQVYKEYSSEDDKVNIKRKWNPYWIYKNYSRIPTEMQKFFEEHMDQFVEQESEFSLKTPKRMVDKFFKSGFKKELLELAEISQSKFEIHLSNPGDAKVTLEKDGMVVHRAGDLNATLTVLDKAENGIYPLYKELEQIIPQKDYKYYESGIIDINSYLPSKILKIKFTDKQFDEGASIKLSNLLTVGQSDTEIHGIIYKQKGLEFVAYSYLVYDNSEFEILFTEESNNPVLYIRPINTTITGLLYLYRKLKEKFDPRIERQIIDGQDVIGG